MSTLTYKCPNCGGGLIFDPPSQKYKCEFCLSDFSQEELEAMNQEEEADGSAVCYTCPSCGAEVVTDSTTAATFCYYCHNPVVLSGKLQGAYEPDYVVPFVIDRKKAEEIFVQWVTRKKFVPKEFFSKKQIETMTGVYFPYWLYSCQVDGKVEAEGTKLRTWWAGNIRYTENKIYQVTRDGRLPVSDVPRNALKKADRRLSEGVFPYEMDKKEDFSMGYLSGFQAENRDMDWGEFAAEVENEVKDFASSSLKQSINGYDRVQIRHQEADIVSSDWKYALLPVWTLTYNDKKKGKIYYFALNGQTGKICGELPVDYRRLAAMFAGIFFPLFILLLIGGYFI